MSPPAVGRARGERAVRGGAPALCVPARDGRRRARAAPPTGRLCRRGLGRAAAAAPPRETETTRLAHGALRGPRRGDHPAAARRIRRAEPRPHVVRTRGERARAAARRCLEEYPARAPRREPLGGRRRRKAALRHLLPRELGVARSGGALLGAPALARLLGARARLRGRRALGGRRGHARVSRGGRHCRSRAVSARRRARVPDRGLGLVGRSRGVAVLHGEIRRRARVLRPRWIVCRRSAGRGLCGNQPVRRVRGRRDDSARTRRKI